MAKPRRASDVPGPAAAWTAAALAAAAAAHVCAALRTPLGAASDDALHLLLARNLLAGGYAVPDAAGVPVTDPLPGFALLMALPVKLLAPRWGLLRGAEFAAFGALAYALWRLSRRLSGEAAARAAVLLAATNPVVSGWAGVSLPDIPFAAVAALGLLALSGEEPSWTALSALAALGALLRPEGAVLAAALAAGAGFRDGPKRAAAVLGAALTPLLLWMLRGRLLAGSASAYFEHWSQLQTFSGAGLLVRGMTVAAGLSRGFFGGIRSDAHPALAATAGLALLAAGAVTAELGARRIWRDGGAGARAFVLAAFVATAGLTVLHLGWPVWQSRYALAFLPALAPLWAAAFAGLLEKKRGAALALLLSAAASGAWLTASYAAEGVRTPTVELWPRTSAWLRANTSAGEGVVSTEASLVALTAGRKAYFPAPAASRVEWVAGLRARGVRWLLIRAGGPRAYLSADAQGALSAYDDWAVPSPPLSVAFVDDAEGCVILRLD